MKVINYHGFKIYKDTHNHNGVKINVYQVEQCNIVFYNLNNAKDYIERNYLR